MLCRKGDCKNASTKSILSTLKILWAGKGQRKNDSSIINPYQGVLVGEKEVERGLRTMADMCRKEKKEP